MNLALGIENSELIRIRLQSADGKQYKPLQVPIAKEMPTSSPRFDKPSQILPENIGYLRIPRFMSGEQEFLDDLVSLMHKFRNTEGLIIDIRENFGGSPPVWPGALGARRIVLFSR